MLLSKKYLNMNTYFRFLFLAGFFIFFLFLPFSLAFASPYGSGNYSTSIYNGEAPTPTSTPAPVVQTVSNAVSNVSSAVSSVLGSWTCTAESPRSAPDLFQINTTGSQAIIYFAPAQRPYTEYYVSFGDGTESEGYGAGFQLSQTSGALKYDVYYLKPNMNYTFKVRAGNDCKAGPWSSTMTVKTGAKNTTRLARFYPKKQAVNTYKAPSLASKLTTKATGTVKGAVSAARKLVPGQAAPQPTKAASKPKASPAKKVAPTRAPAAR
jgi:hypothetical protein